MSTLEEVCERVRKRIGTVTRDDLGPVSAKDFQRFAVAAGEPPGDTAPPLFLSSVLGWGAGPADDALRPDGTGDETAGLPLDGLRLMGAGQDLDFHAPVRDGTQVVRETSVEDVTLKQGGSGPFLVITMLRMFSDESGTPLVICRDNLIARPEATR
ncbi:MaoC dehydratase-like protein [Actinomadura pelletieri DSM 43383]|uniref:MaoC dehydratase-like protein n=1 Tax=Actinomadura pelletieri DSM 43383 TaxID=1120940 RepID=A0A495QTA1_9ACTN|nr:MaoC family dehydratase N-terminal domain-containing protein [Actinomadura pelletieri]RKS76631.1 MaoC dehydratase-like protein [Actinomadura pelletieri DSM 43383]